MTQRHSKLLYSEWLAITRSNCTDNCFVLQHIHVWLRYVLDYCEQAAGISLVNSLFLLVLHYHSTSTVLHKFFYTKPRSVETWGIFWIYKSIALKFHISMQIFQIGWHFGGNQLSYNVPPDDDYTSLLFSIVQTCLLYRLSFIWRQNCETVIYHAT